MGNGLFPAPPVAGSLIIGIAVYAVLREVDVRLVLFPAALALGALAGADKLPAIVQTFFDAKAVVPICSALGLAASWSTRAATSTSSAGEAPADAPALARDGSITALGAASGRTMSPALEVTPMGARLTETTPADLMKRAAVPLLAHVAAAIRGTSTSPA